MVSPLSNSATEKSKITSYPNKSIHAKIPVLKFLTDAVTPTYLSSSHPRPLIGNWQTGFALDFHSSFTGADWNCSTVGKLVYRLKYQSDLASLCHT